MSTVNLIYLVVVKPLATKTENRIEIFNETIIMLCSHCVNIFLNIAISLEVRDLMGWVLMGLAIFNILGNLSIIVKNSLFDMYNSYQAKQRKNKALIHFLRRFENRKYLIDNLPKEFTEEMKLEKEAYEVVLWVQEYYPGRVWMQRMGIDFSTFEDEIRY